MTVLVALLASASESRGGGGERSVALFDVPEAELIARLRADDESVYQHVYAMLAPRLIAIAEGYVPAAVAEEVMQDALLELWANRSSWPAERGISVYLYTVVRHRAIDQARRLGMIGRVAATAGVVQPDAPLGGSMPPERPDERIERHDLAASIARALALLPDRPRTAFTLRWIHQLSYADVATIMGISDVAARKHVSRARETLMDVLKTHLNR